MICRLLDSRRHQLSTIALVFVNSGNRPATILSVKVFYIQEISDTTEECQLNYSTAWFDTDFVVSVAKESDTVARKVKVTGPSYLDPPVRKTKSKDKFAFPMVEQNKKKETFEIKICLQIIFATPSRSDHLKIIKVLTYLAVQPGGIHVPEGGTNEGEKPQILHREFRTILSDYIDALRSWAASYRNPARS